MLDITPRPATQGGFRYDGACQQAPPDRSPGVTVVLVHGAWADVSCWRRVIPLLHADNLAVLAVRNPLTSLDDSVAATRRVIAQARGPVVLVGHGWAGSVITQAGATPGVAALVYIAAPAPDVGECDADLVRDYPRPPAFSTVMLDSQGLAFQTADGLQTNIAPDLPRHLARTMAVTQGPLSARALADRVSVAAWRSLPTWYIVSAQDRVIAPELERAAARRMGARTTVLQGSHACPLSQPVEVAAVIADAADWVARPRAQRRAWRDL